MSSLSAKDRVSLCSFTFSDGRRCRTPRIRNNPRFCPYHAQKEARARAAQKLGKDLDYFFSGDYLSACDLSTALGRLIPAVVRGDVKPKTAHTVAYLAQTLLQAIHISEQEYINTFGTDGWRKSIRNSVNGNHDYRFPPAPEPEQPALSALRTNLPSESPQPQPAAVAAVAHPFRGEASRPASPPQPQPAAQPPAQTHRPAQPQGRAQQPSPSPHTPLPPTGAEFVQHVMAGLQTGEKSSTPPNPPQPGSHPAETPVNCHSERSADFALRENLRSEEPAFSSSPAQSPTSAHAPQTPAAHTATSHPVCHPERSAPSALRMGLRSEGSHPLPSTPVAPSAAPTAQPDNPPRTCPPTPQPAPNRDAYALHFDHNYRLLIDGKPF